MYETRQNLLIKEIVILQFQLEFQQVQQVQEFAMGCLLTKFLPLNEACINNDVEAVKKYCQMPNAEYCRTCKRS